MCYLNQRPLNYIFLYTCLFFLSSCSKPETPSTLHIYKTDGLALIQKKCDEYIDAEYTLTLTCFIAQRSDSAEFNFPVSILSSGQKEKTLSPSSTSNRQAIIMIPGGPGQGNTTSQTWIEHWVTQFQALRAESDFTHFDVVLYVPRSTKQSSNFYRCDAYETSAQDLLTKNISYREEVNILTPLLEACIANYNDHLKVQHGMTKGIQMLNTEAYVTDLHALLDSLNYKSYHLWGTSYGTRIALAGASHSRVKTLVLDSPYPFDKGTLADWPRTLKNSLLLHDHYYTRYRNSERHEEYITLLKQAMKALEHQPLTLQLNRWDTHAAQILTLNASRLLDVQFDVLYNETLLPLYYEALEALPKKTMALETVLEAYITNLLDDDFSTLTYIATECNDNTTGNYQDFQKASNDFPIDFYDWDFIYETDMCHSTFFTQAHTIASQTYYDKPTLIFSGELDPVTPVSWAVALQKQLPRAQLIRVSNIGHSVLSSDVCQLLALAYFWQTSDTTLPISCAYDH